MKILALRLYNVKRFATRGVAIEGIRDGVNVLCAANEFGKSTSFEALYALFFQPHTSSSSDVRNLRPYSGGNPLVEADISLPEGSFRITKRFLSKSFARVFDLSTGRLVAQADEAENLIDDFVHVGSVGPGGLLWVRQGITGLERRSKAEEEGEARIRSSLLQSVQGEVEAVTGGRRMAEIIAATDEALGRLVTPTGRPKAGSAYALAIERLRLLEEEERRIRADVTALREALERRVIVSKRLAELDRAEARDERRRAVDAAQATFDAAKSWSEALRTAEAELLLAQQQRDSAHRNHLEFRSALGRSRALRAEFVKAEEKSRRARQLAAELAQRDVQLARKQAVVDDLRKNAVDFDAAEATLKRVRSAAEAAENEIARLKTEMSGLTAEIRTRSDDAVEEKWLETVGALNAASARVANCEKEVAILTRLRNALLTARSDARDAYLRPVLSELRPLLGLLFDDVSITFDEATLLPQKISRSGQEEDVERLSGGMREQLSVLTRLAFARLLAKAGRPAPVILDDALVYSDDDRIEKMFDALHRQARELQIIVFSCRQRAFQKLGGNILQMSEWTPSHLD